MWVCGWNTDTKSLIRKINGYLGYHKGKYPKNRIKSTKNRVTELWLQNCKNGYVGYGGWEYGRYYTEKDLKELLEEWDMMEEILQHDRFDFETDEDKLEEFYEDVLEDFSDDTGVGSKGYDALSEHFCDAWEFAGDIGKRSTGILDVYMLAFQLATEQLKEKGVI